MMEEVKLLEISIVSRIKGRIGTVRMLYVRVIGPPSAFNVSNMHNLQLLHGSCFHY